MKIVCMSDSHGADSAVKYVLEMEKDADIFIHCGDVCSDTRQFPNVLFVCGNCDYNKEPLFRVVDCEGISIFMIHSHKISDRTYGLAALAKEHNCQICCFGHTHRLFDETINGVRLLNPGSLHYNRDGNELGYLVINVIGTEYEVVRKTLRRKN